MLFSCPEEQFEEIVFWKKSVYPSVTMSKELLAFCGNFFLAWSEKRHSLCPQAQFGEEFTYLFGRNLVFLFFASVHRVFFCGFRQNIFGSVVRSVFYVSIEYICGKTLFAEEKLFFFHHFRTLGHFSAMPLFQLFGGIVKTPFQVLKCISRKVFFKKVFLLLLGMNQKDLIF